jgi:hypothetical protein
MNTGQMLMTIGALVLLSTLFLRVNTNYLQNTTTTNNAKFEILAASLASSIIEEASDKAFDNNTVNGPVTDLSQLTLPDSLGPDDGDQYPNFNDIDDYNGFTKTDSTLPSAIFNLSCSVCYVSNLDPDQVSSTATWTKKITVSVTSASMSDTVKLSTLYSYWNFR